MMQLRATLGLLVCLIFNPASGQQAPAADDGLRALYRQAEFWEANGRNDLASEALRRVLDIAPDDPEALYRLARLAMNEGDETAVNRWAARLQRAAPNSLQTRQLEQLRRRGRVDSAGLAEARRLAQAGEAQAALSRYRDLFPPDSPPPDLALEYYQTMAGISTEWEAARRGLQELVEAQPGDRAAALALAEVLTWRESSRTEGIGQLEQLAEQGSDERTRQAWRQALIWLPGEQRHAGYFRRYLERFPDDAAVRQKLADSERVAPGADRAAGYAALARQADRQARNAFNRALRENPNDAEALAGLGLVQLRANEFGAAEVSLARASRLAPEQASKWRDALASARFYGELAAVRELVAAENYDAAEARLTPLARDAQRGRDARLLEADILLRRSQPEAAERHYRALLEEDDSLIAARSGLANALLAQRRFDEAERLFASLPVETRGDTDVRQQRVNALREDAEVLIARGEAARGEELLQQALTLAPNDPWVRLALARLTHQRGQPGAAERLMWAVSGEQATPSGLRAAAVLAVDQARWEDAALLLRRIPSVAHDAESRELLAAAERGQRIAALDITLTSNDPWQVNRALQQLYSSPPTDPRELGAAADTLVVHGEATLARVLVRRDLSTQLAQRDDIEPAHYLAHVRVLAQTGEEFEAERLLRRLAQAARGDGETLRELETVRRGLVVARTDRLREQGAMAQAYDELVRELNRTPEDIPLLLALGRLYQQGEMHEEAREVQDYVLSREAGSSEARQAAIQGALAAGDARRAEQLLADAAPLTEPPLLLLAARTAHMQGEKREALRLARQAREAEQARSLARHEPWQAGVLADLQRNPFRRQGGAGHQSRWQAMASAPPPQASERGAWLPGQRATPGSWQPSDTNQRRYASQAFDTERALARDDSAGDGLGTPLAPPASAWQSWGYDNWAADAPGYQLSAAGAYGLPDAPPTAAPGSRRPLPAEATRVAEIDAFMDQLQDELAPQVDGALALRHRDGESGLSGLTEVRGEVALSTVPFESGRVSLSAAPVFLNSGSVSGNAQARFGSGSLVAGATELDETLAGVQPLLAEGTQAARNVIAAQEALDAANALPNTTPQELAALAASLLTAELNFESAAARNPLFEAGLDLDALSVEQRAFVDDFLLREFGSADLSLDDTSAMDYLASSAAFEQLVGALRGRAITYARAAPRPDAQTAAGLGLSLGWQDGAFQADIGSTPLGFEVENIVGGLLWQPQIAPGARLLLRAQRRAVTDSLLSYGGVKDPVTGRYWGGVVRTGGDLGVSYDDGYLGLYGNIGLYRYTGRQVADNRAVLIGLGTYIRPIREQYRSLQAGVNVNYMGFRDNLGYFTLGHGGYFSPKSFVSLSVPVTYSQTRQRLTWRATIAPGFQSYSQEESAYFPTRPREQMWMDILATSGVLPASRYSADSDSGLGLNVGVGMDYLVGPGLKLGARIDHDTFGEYSETSALIHLNYMMEQAP